MGWFSGPRRQQEQQIARLLQENAQLQARVAELEAEKARLIAQLAAARKHSGNSSKPPSSYEAPKPFVREPKIGRNDPCPCGSSKKYKKCCGKN